MSITDTKLKTTRKKALEKGHWPLVAALDTLLLDSTSLDSRINLLGAMHEVGLLTNSLAPYWAVWRTAPSDVDQWTTRCIERLHTSDHDYWALAALLALPLTALSHTLQQRNYKLLSIRFANSYKDGKWHIATFAGKHEGRVIAPVLELGWDDNGHINEATRWRAVILDQQTETSGNLVATGSGTYFLRAKLPYGSWRIHDEPFQLKEEWLVPKPQTALAHYP